jgi:DNA-binding CsgD family transcriptional regulator
VSSIALWFVGVGYWLAAKGRGRVRSILLDRSSERQFLDHLIADVRAGESGALVVRGEAGVGKTALLDFLAERATGCRIVRAGSAESEMELPFAGVHQLCAPMLNLLGRLPAPQRDALSTAFGLSAGNPPDRFLVGLAVLGLFAEVARSRPLVCVLDDAQWLDRASAQLLAFVARRLLAESVAMIFAVREAPMADRPEVPELAGLAELPISGLPDDDARLLLTSTYRGPVDASVFDRVLAEARGNPLALLELPQGLTAAQLAGGFALPDASPLTNRIEQSFLARLEPLPAPTRQLLLAAAADPTGDLPLLLRAAQQLGIAPNAAAPAKAAGLIDLGTTVRFRHPLLRSAIYGRAGRRERQEVHAALAEATDPRLDPDRRAWHRAHAAAGPDETVAEELQHSAGRAQARGGLAAAAAFLERATELTPSPERRVHRALAAAEAELQIGALDSATLLLSTAETAPLDELQRARIELLRAELAFASSRGKDAPPLLLAAARRLESLDATLARDTYLDALSAAMFAGRLAGHTGPREVARAARQAPRSREPSLADLLLEALSTLFTDGYSAAVPTSKRMLSAFRSDDVTVEEGLRWYWLVTAISANLWDDESWHILASRYVQMAREAGALSQLPLALNSSIVVELFAGEIRNAALLVGEAGSVTETIGTELVPYGALWLAAWQGDEQDARLLRDTTLAEAAARGEGIGLTITQTTSALRLNALGQYELAVVDAQQASEAVPELAGPNWALSELVEAATRVGNLALAADAFERLSAMTSASGTEWALGIEARCRALRSNDEAAEPLYLEAIDRLGRTRVRVELSRAHLLYGEWLRRTNRRLEAREQLRAAHETFTTMGARIFAQRAARELAATGETVRKRTVETVSDLTAQETQIARMVREGLSNSEIGARLFISSRTVEWHLSKIFAKLQITSRRQLRK